MTTESESILKRLFILFPILLLLCSCGVTHQEAQIAATARAEELKRKYAEEKAGIKGGKGGEKKSDFVSFDSEDFFSAAKKRSLEKLKNE